MNLRMVNRFFGYAYIAMGFLKGFIVVMAIMSILSLIGAAFSSSTIDISALTDFKGVVGIAELIIFGCSIILFLINMVKEPSATMGYGITIIIVLCEMFVPRGFLWIFAFILCGAYIKAGRLLLTYGGEPVTAKRTTKKEINDTKWFYEDK